MNQILLALIAAFPFLLLFILLIFRHWPAIRALPVVWFVTLLSSVFIWRIESVYISASFIRGVFMALEIILIIFGAVWVLEILKKTKHMNVIQDFLANISPDIRIQGIIIGWLFVSLMEGVAGFGTPAAIAAPLLVALGFAPLLAVSVTLIANSVATTFGAAGTPILLGFGNLGLKRIVLEQTGQMSAIFHFIASIIIPISIVYLIVTEYKKINPNKKNINTPIKSTIPFCVFAWLAFGIPYILSTIFIGPELPSIIGAIFGLTVVSIAAKKGFLIPKQTMMFKKKKRKNVSLKNILISTFPYIAIVLFLMITRTIMPLRSLIQSIQISIPSILGSSIGFSYQPLFTPAFYFILTGLISLFVFKTSFKHAKETAKNSFMKIRNATVALIFALGLVQLLMASENNLSGIASMPLILAESVGKLFGQAFPIISPLIGAFGSFISGSNTVSNILFGAFQNQSAISLGISVPIILALQAAGGAIGNMIAIHNVLAASATVGLHHKESKIIRKTIVVAILYSLIVGILGFIAINIF